MHGPWILALPPGPAHIAGCDRSEPYGETCAACRLLEIDAWNHWVALFQCVPAAVWWPQGMGQG